MSKMLSVIQSPLWTKQGSTIAGRDELFEVAGTTCLRLREIAAGCDYAFASVRKQATNSKRFTHDLAGHSRCLSPLRLV